jgi:hypothetical protein
MPRTIRRTSRFVCSAHRLVSVLTSAELLEARHQLQGAATVRTADERPAEGRLVQRVETAEHARTITGVDLSRTEPAVTTYDWNLAGRTCRWEWVGAWGARVAITGDLEVRASSETTCEIVSQTTVRVNMPLIGGLIEKRIASEIEASMSKVEPLVQRLAESGTTDVIGKRDGVV